MSESIGVLQAVAAGDESSQVLEIVTRRGDVVTIAAPDVLAAKVFPASGADPARRGAARP